MIQVEITDITTGEKRSVTYPQTTLVIGKAEDADILFVRPNVSRKHARILLKDGLVWVEDMNSTNGVLLNGHRLQGSAPLQPADEVRIGDYVLRARGSAVLHHLQTVQAPEVQKPASPPAAKAPEKAKPELEGEILTRDTMYDQTIKGFLGEAGTWLADPGISEIMINGPDHVYIERGGKLVLADFKFKSEDAVMVAIRNIAQYVGRRIAEDEPYMDARLPDGSRVACMIRPCCRCGPSISIRKFSKRRLSMQDLVNFGSISEDGVRFVDMCVQLHKNLLVSGGTGSGKTSLLNIVSGLIPPDERIIVIEDSSELQLQQEHVVPWESRPKDKEGKGEFSIRDLVKAALRFRPDRIIVGEIRGGEALDLLQAMNTGHSGSMGTVHASSPVQTLSRMETLALFAGFDVPIIAMRSQVASSIEIILQTARLRDGSRKVTHLSEVLEMSENGNYRTQDIFRHIQTGIDTNGKCIGSMVSTGIVPTFFDQFAAFGIQVPQGFFEKKEPVRG